jgi:hypothetical protein
MPKDRVKYGLVIVVAIVSILLILSTYVLGVKFHPMDALQSFLWWR